MARGRMNNMPDSATDQSRELRTALDRVGYYPSEVAAAVEDSLAGPRGCEVEEVPDTGEGLQRLSGDAVEEILGVSESSREGGAHLEVVRAVWLVRDLSVDVLDAALQVCNIQPPRCGHRVSISLRSPD
jgi:hypothetical protein